MQQIYTFQKGLLNFKTRCQARNKLSITLFNIYGDLIMSNPNTIAQQKTLIENIDLAPNRDNEDELIFKQMCMAIYKSCSA